MLKALIKSQTPFCNGELKSDINLSRVHVPGEATFSMGHKMQEDDAIV